MFQNRQQYSHFAPPDPYLGPFCPPLSLIFLLPLKSPASLDPSPIAILGAFLLDKNLLTRVFLPFLFLCLTAGCCRQSFYFSVTPNCPLSSSWKPGSAKHCWKISFLFRGGLSLSLLFQTEKRLPNCVCSSIISVGYLSQATFPLVFFFPQAKFLFHSFLSPVYMYSVDAFIYCIYTSTYLLF